MAKNGKPISAQAQEISNLPVKAPPTYLAEYAAEAGAGTSQAAEDNIVPLLYVLHPLHPQCDRRDPRYVEGAEGGDILLRNAPQGLELVKCSAGEKLLVQPCYFYRDVGEWLPRSEGGGGGGGFICRHPQTRAKDVPGAKQWHNRKTGEMDPNSWATANGEHDLVEARNHIILVYLEGRALPYLIPLQSTGHSSSRQWMMKMNDKVIGDGPNRGKPYPSYAHLYYLRTEQRSNNDGKWYSLVVEDAEWATAEQAAAGRKLHDQLKSGEKTGATPEASYNVGAERAAADAAAEQVI